MQPNYNYKQLRAELREHKRRLQGAGPEGRDAEQQGGEQGERGC